MPANPLSVLLAVLRVFDGAFQRGLGDADAGQADKHTRAFEQLQCLEQTAAGVPRTWASVVSARSKNNSQVEAPTSPILRNSRLS